MNATYNLLQNHVHGSGICGGAILIAGKRQTVDLFCAGLSDAQASTPVTADTLWHWASVTKTFTSVAILRLAALGKIRVDDPLVRWIPELRQAWNPFGPMDAVTIRHALSHTSGFRDPTWPWGGHEHWHPFEPARWSQITAMMPYTRIHFEPGSAYGYSNPAFIFLGRIIERVTGESYTAHIRRHLFAPLGMEESFFDIPPRKFRNRMTDSYRLMPGKGLQPFGKQFSTGITRANGGLNATMGDMGRWIRCLMALNNGGANEPGGAPEVRFSGTGAKVAKQACKAEADDSADAAIAGAKNAATLRDIIPSDEIRGLLHEPVATVPPEKRTLDPDSPEETTCGLFRFRAGGRTLYGHTGEQRGFRVFIIFDPDRGEGAACALNTAIDAGTASPSPNRFPPASESQNRLSPSPAHAPASPSTSISTEELRTMIFRRLTES
jgi:CubicO group peptidase (beta-lactamase class C family)